MTVLIVSDIHANQVALEAVLEAAGDVSAVWNLGDVVGYGPKPGECIDRITQLHPIVSLIGNHDWAAIGRLQLDEFNPVDTADPFSKLDSDNGAGVGAGAPAAVTDVADIDVSPW